MTPRIEELIDYLDRERAGIDAAIASVPSARHTAKASPEAWCVAEVVNHVALTDGRITALLSRITGEARAAGAGPDHDASPILPTIDVSRFVDRSQKVRNPRGDPSPDASVADGLAALDRARDQLKKLLRSADLPNLNLVSAPHPAFGALTGYQWVAFMAAHTRRHADQIRECGG
jgi:hypothetical protein